MVRSNFLHKTILQTDNEKDKENLSSSIGLKQLSKDTSKTDTPEKIVETDLDKDLDHFELTAGPNLPEADSKNTAKESSTEGPKEVSSHVDLLSSSREKLLKSLQKKLNSPVVDPASSQFSAENNIKKTSDSQSISAFSFSSTRTCANEDRIKSDSLDIASNSEMITNSVLDKHNSNVSAVEKSVPVSVPVLSPTIYSDNYAKEKSQSDLGNIPSDFNSKQKLREKLSADICELYRVPGRSVGGSLRSLKDVKDNKKSVVLEEEELFKPDKITEVRHHSNSLTCNDSKKIKSQKSLSVFKSDYKVNRNKDKSSVKKQHDSENLQDDKKRDEMEPKLSESGRDKSDLARDWLDKKMAGGSHSKEGKKLPDGSCRKEKGSEIDSFDDEELLEFVKENVQSLPHLSKLKPSDLRRVHSSLFSSTATPEADKDSLISEDSFQDLDDFMNQENLLSDNKLNLKASEGLENTKQSEDESRIPSLGLKATEIVDGSVSKAVKTFIKPAEKEKIGESTDNKTNDLVKSKIQSADESDFIHKLIEDIPSNTAVVKKKKGVLDLPIPKHDSLPLPKLDSNPISDSSELSKVVPVSNRDPRNKKLMPSKPSGDVNRPLIRLESEVHTSLTNNYFNPNLYLDPNYTSRFYSAAHPQILHRNNYAERISRFNHPLECLPRDPLMEPRFPNSVQISLFPTNQIMPHDMNQVPSYGFYNFNDIKYRQAGHFHNNSRSSRYRNDFFKNGDHHFSRPKSYVEYKRIKLIKEKKLDERKSQKKSEQKNGVSGNMCMSNSIRMPAEKEIVNSENSVTTQGKEILNSNQKSKRKKKSKSAKFKTNSNSMIQQETNQKLELTKIQKTAPTESKKEGEESKKKIVNERRQSLDCEDTVSPLVKLYQSGNAPKTGRGYGLQNFKIPKKVREDNTIIKPKASNTLVQDIKPTGKEEKQGSLTNRLNPLKEPGEKENDVLNEDEVSMNTTVKEDNLLINLQTADENELCCNKNICESQNNFNEFKIKSNITNLSSTLSTNIEKSIINTISSSVRDETEIEVLNTEKKSNGAKINENENCATKSENENDSEKVKERDLTICDSSSENTICQSETVESKSTCEKRPAVVKEEITQEFVEALIRKSFESGEGKLLLAQAKLFEEFTKKLNSKKLKTIQKIINSESDSSSSSTESSSEIEKKKKKNKKSERSKKKKKKVRRSRKLKSSSSERDESSEEETVEKKENPVIIDKQKNEEKVMESEFKKADIGPNENITIIPVDQNSKSCHLTLNLPSENKGNNKSPKVNLKECISRKKNQRKQGQKRLLEQILKEDHQPPELEMENNNSKSEDPDEKELEQKTKPKPKGKGKTELDRLHDDIRSMFISSGVVTATGQRMCRMLKASGGSMNNLDIVKESAKMVQEQKLKNVQSPRCTRRSRSKNVRNRRDRSSSQSSEVLSSRDRSKSETRSGIADTSKGSELILTGPILSTDNLKKRPCVVLHKLELNNFKYGRKTGMGSISFCSVRGRNVAMRGRSWRRVSSSSSMQISILEKDLAKNVFLARNKRKYESLIGKKIAKCYRGKSLTEIVKYLPLKMAKMKHLEIGENKSDKAFKEIKRNKNVSSKKNKKKRRCDSTPSTINDADILDYAFEKKKVIYPCKLCLHLTRNITSHYKTAHPDSEVLISRLSKEEAQKAIKDSRENNYSGTSLHQSSSLEMIRRRVKSKLNGSVAYYCRMCNSAKFTYKNAFFSHVSTHTGEYRFKCPSEGCSVTMATKENLKYHILSNHSESRYDLYRKIIELFPLPKESGSVYGYICSKCHYVQMFYGELERHVQKYHSSHENVSIIKIDMSAKVSPEPEKIVGIKKAKTWKKILDDSEGSNDEEENLENSNENINIELENEEETSIMALGEVRKLRKRKHPDTDSPLQTALNEVELKDATEENSESRASKKPLLEKKMESIKQCESIKHNVDEKESSDENARTGDKATDLENKSSESCVPESVTLDNCYDVKNVSQLTGSADINFFENSNKKNVSQSGSDLLKNSSGSAQKQGTRKLKVGPLEVQM